MDSDYSDAQDSDSSCDEQAEGSTISNEAKLPITLSRKYTPQDLYPTDKDPLCIWAPLASYWPLYVGNFRVESWCEDACRAQVQNYFAHRGFLTRMIVFQRFKNDQEFAMFQENHLLIDMLVYFTSQADAMRAMSTCHMDSYYGYKLNVLPGRKPVFYDNSKSLRFVHVGSEQPHEYNIVRLLSRIGPINYAARFPPDDVVVQFGSVNVMLQALQSQYRWRPQELTGQVMKQRFVERDIIKDISWAMDVNEHFLDMKPSEEVLRRLFEGLRPIVSTAWSGHNRPKKSPFWLNVKRVCRQGRYKIKQFQKQGQKRNIGKKWTSGNIHAANAILAKHHLGPISKLGIRASTAAKRKEHEQSFRLHRMEVKQAKMASMRGGRKGGGGGRNVDNSKIHPETKTCNNQVQKGSDRRRLRAANFKLQQKLKRKENRIKSRAAAAQSGYEAKYDPDAGSSSQGVNAQ